jgi:uncharacterized protein (DUF1330 family)
MSACIVALVDITDPVQYEAYKPLASAAARAFYDSPTYRAAREARAGAARMTMLLVEGPA